MMRAPIAFTLGGAVFFLAVACHRRTADQNPPTPQETPPVSHTSTECIKQADGQISRWKSEGKTEPEIARLYQAELAHCSGAESSVANFVGAVNFDFARLGRQFLSDQLAPDAYLGLVKDRSRKLRLARRDEGWVSAFANGDQDGDLVPDDRDQCPETSDLTPTDDQGCPRKEPLPAGPSPEEVKKAKAALKIAISPGCLDAPPPSISEPLKIGLDSADEESYLIAVSKVTNEPAGCPIFYEINLHIENRSFFAGTKKSDAHVVFRASENVDASPAAQSRQVFRIRKANFPLWGELTRLPVEPNETSLRQIRVRVMNGNGLSSSWSGPTTYKMTRLTRFFPTP